MCHSRKKLLNIDNNLEYKEYQKLEKSLNMNKKYELSKYLDKSPLPTIMLLNIYVNTSHNTFQKNKSSMLRSKEKLKNTNISQFKGKLFTILKMNSALQPYPLFRLELSTLLELPTLQDLPIQQLIMLPQLPMLPEGRLLPILLEHLLLTQLEHQHM